MNIPNPEKIAVNIAENTTLLVISRLSMLLTPVLLSATVWFGHAWIEGQFDDQAAVSRSLRRDVDVLRDELPLAKERIKIVETTIARGREDREQFQEQTGQKLDKITDLLTAIVREQSALRATVEAQQRQIDRRERGR